MTLEPPAERPHAADCENGNWYYCVSGKHWLPRNRKRPVNWCYEDSDTGRRSNPGDLYDCACETINEQAYEDEMHIKYGEVY